MESPHGGAVAARPTFPNGPTPRPRPFAGSLPMALAALLFFCLAGFATPAGATESIRLGMSAGFHGPTRGLAVELYRGAMAYFEHINATGGVDGKNIVLLARNDDYDPLPAIANTIALVEDDVVALFSYLGTPTVTRVLPLLKSYGQKDICLFFPFSGAQPQREPPYAQYVFNLRASYRAEVKALVDALATVGRTKLAVFYQADAYGRSGWDGARLALADHGLSLVAEATYRRGSSFETDMRPQVEILRKKAPDAVISVGAYPACAAFIRDARAAGLDVPIANVSFVGSDLLLRLLLREGTRLGRDLTKGLINSQVVPSYEDVSLPAVRQYRRLMETYGDRLPLDLVQGEYHPFRFSQVGFEGFLNAKVMVEILRRMPNPLDRSQLRAAAEGLHDLDIGIGRPVRFGPGRHDGLDQVFLTQVVSDQFVPIRDFSVFAK
ncbi:ABC transporter substrate-binding protein [Desulfolutivibrio sp.]|uniref:ABC transporter substrate-binding protein n=1 Tax=Desulfolutivibrio sp. TaxID=2773296 RepID=UPI002F96CC34